jgi:hypothetical protein
MYLLSSDSPGTGHSGMCANDVAGDSERALACRGCVVTTGPARPHQPALASTPPAPRPTLLPAPSCPLPWRGVQCGLAPVARAAACRTPCVTLPAAAVTAPKPFDHLARGHSATWRCDTCDTARDAPCAAPSSAGISVCSACTPGTYAESSGACRWHVLFRCSA